jgi:predicted nucleic acid-binding Zn ribbon protein
MVGSDELLQHQRQRAKRTALLLALVAVGFYFALYIKYF